MSLTKGMAAIPLALAHPRGLLGFDETVATYWPEFAQHGKDQTTVRQLLSHQAGLPVIDANVDRDMLDDPDAMAGVLARQMPLWEPGARHGDHAVSLGLFEAELLRRVDPQARTLGRYFAEEIAAPLDLEFYIGLPDDLPNERRATLHTPKPTDALKCLHRMPWRYVAGLVKAPWASPTQNSDSGTPTHPTASASPCPPTRDPQPSRTPSTRPSESPSLVHSKRSSWLRRR